MLGLITGFLSTNLGKYLMIAIAAIGVYFWWESRVENRALLDFNQKQMEQLLKDQKELDKKLTDLRQIQDQILENEKQFKQNLDKKLSGISGFLSSDEAKKLDRPSSEILKKTIREAFQ
jgi:CHASE3 domain sensor protein